MKKDMERQGGKAGLSCVLLTLWHYMMDPMGNRESAEVGQRSV